MRVEPLVIDAPAASAQVAQPNDFARLLDDLGATLERAEGSENAYASGTGTLQHAVYERARADVALGIAVAAASRATQALQSVLNMQV